MSGGITGLEQMHKILENIDLAGYPQSSIVGIPELFLGKPKQILKQRVVQIIGFQIKPAHNVFTHIHPNMTLWNSVCVRV